MSAVPVSISIAARYLQSRVLNLPTSPAARRRRGGVSELPAYLELVWGDALATDPSLWIVGWELTRKTSFAARLIDLLADWLITHNKTTCVYTHAGLVRSFAGSRPSANDIACVPGLWADIDVRDPVHAEQHLPPSLDTVRSFLATLPLVPSVIVFTGHGVLAWWLFNEHFFIDTPMQRGEIATLSLRWQASLRERLGYAMDATHDLARLTRPAGVVNRKSAPVATRIVEQNGRRYSLDDFRDVGLPEIDVASPEARGRGHHANDHDAKFPPARLEPILRGCAWLRHCYRDRRMLPEPQWHAMLSIVGRTVDGEASAQSFSEGHPEYTALATRKKLAHALVSPGPSRCAWIDETTGGRWCGGCACKALGLRSPLQLGRMVEDA